MLSALKYNQLYADSRYPDPDPSDQYAFGPPGSGSGSGSFYHQAKIVRKTLIHTFL
jgi:hypothetical protein